MADGWRCPECALILAPDVREHRCDPPSGGVSVRPVPAPYKPPSISGTYAWPAGSGVSAGRWPEDAIVTNACDVYGSCGHASCAVAPRPLKLVPDSAA